MNPNYKKIRLALGVSEIELGKYFGYQIEAAKKIRNYEAGSLMPCHQTRLNYRLLNGINFAMMELEKNNVERALNILGDLLPIIP